VLFAAYKTQGKPPIAQRGYRSFVHGDARSRTRDVRAEGTPQLSALAGLRGLMPTCEERVVAGCVDRRVLDTGDAARLSQM
jgi:hypothetical protein